MERRAPTTTAEEVTLPSVSTATDPSTRRRINDSQNSATLGSGRRVQTERLIHADGGFNGNLSSKSNVSLVSKHFCDPDNVSENFADSAMAFNTMTDLKLLNWLYEFQDLSLFKEFQSFHKTRSLPYFFKFSLVLITLILFPLSIYNIIAYTNLTPARENNNSHKGDFLMKVVFQVVIDFLMIILTFVSWKIFGKHIPLHGGMVTRMWSFCTSCFFIKREDVFFDHKANVNQSASKKIGNIQHSCRMNQVVPTMIDVGESPNLTNLNAKIIWYNVRCEHIFLLLVQLIVMICMLRTVLLRHHSSIDPNELVYQTNILRIPNLLTSEYAEFYSIVSSFWLFSFPYFIFNALTDISVSIVWWMYFVSALFMFSQLIVLEFYRSIPFVCLVIIWFVCMTIDLQLHKVQTFLTNKSMIKQVKEQKQHQSQDLRHMIANVAHDLKTPLASFATGLDCIQMSIEECKQTLLDVSKSTTQDSVVHLDSMQSNIVNIRNTHSFMLMTINRCLDYTKASKGLKLVPHCETIDLMETLYLPLDCMKNIQSRITFSIDALPEIMCSHVITDKQWLQENVLCLLSNAVKYSAEGSVQIRIALEEFVTTARSISRLSSRDDMSFCTAQTSCKALDDPLLPNNPFAKISSPESSQRADIGILAPFIRIEVEDTGIGMSEEAMSSLFNPFKQTQRLAGGTGLGLYSLAKRLEALHGFYGVMKRRDGKQGSLFWFAIPYKPDTMFAHHIPTPKEIEMKRKEANPLNVLQEVLTLNKPPEIESPILEETTENIQPSSLHILLVDDSPPILKMSSLMLKKLGHCVVTAENGAIALKRIEESFHPNTSSQNKKFDLLLIDLQMPIMDGLEAISRIRAMEIGNIAVPTITASSSFGTCAEEKLSFRHKIVGMSANSDSETCTEAFQAGADAFLPKPFTVDAFTEVLQEVGVELH